MADYSVKSKKNSTDVATPECELGYKIEYIIVCLFICICIAIQVNDIYFYYSFNCIWKLIQVLFH